MSKKNLGINIRGEKFVAIEERESHVVKNTLRGYGYKFLPGYFSDIGFPQGKDVFKALSIHKPLAPNVTEIKKLLLLEKAVGVVQDSISAELEYKIAKFPFDELDFRNVLSGDYSYAKFELMQKLGMDFRSAEKSKQIEVLSQEIKANLISKLNKCLKSGDYSELGDIISILRCNLICNNNSQLGSALQSISKLLLITRDDVLKPRFICNKTDEIANDVLGEAITKKNEYLGHWVDRKYLENASFNQILGTWLHEICHKYGGDGTSEFTYTLTDMIRVLLSTNQNHKNTVKLAALEEIYNKLNQNIG